MDTGAAGNLAGDCEVEAFDNEILKPAGLRYTAEQRTQTFNGIAGETTADVEVTMPIPVRGLPKGYGAPYKSMVLPDSKLPMLLWLPPMRAVELVSMFGEDAIYFPICTAKMPGGSWTFA